MSYDPALPTTRDQARLLVGDTDTANELLADGAYDWMLGQEGDDPLRTAARAAEALAAKFALDVDKSSDGDSISSSQRFEHFSQLAEQLRSEAERLGASAIAGPFVGGISEADKRARELDDDRIPTAIRIGIHRHPRTQDQPWISDQS